MTEIYEATFREVHFADFVSDAIPRGKKIFRNCEWLGLRYGCDQIMIPVDMAAFYYVIMEKTFRGVTPSKVGIKNALKFEMRMPMEHVVKNWHDDQTYGIDQLGVRVMYGNSPGPLKIPSTFPGNTHAIIRLKCVDVKLTSNCYTNETLPVLEEYYSQDECVKETFMKAALTTCDCKIIIGDVFPRNAKVCTPILMKECVQKYVLASGVNDTSNQTMEMQMKKFCKERCNVYRYVVQSSFFNLEAEDDQKITINRFTIFYDTTDYLVMSEQSLRDDQGMAVYLGGVWIVYTGMSAVAVVHALTLIVHLGLTKVTRKILCLKKNRSAGNRKKVPRIFYGRVYPMENNFL